MNKVFKKPTYTWQGRQYSSGVHAKITRMHAAKVFERESKTNNELTVANLCQRDDFILLKHFFDFYVSHHHAYSRHHAN